MALKILKISEFKKIVTLRRPREVPFTMLYNILPDI